MMARRKEMRDFKSGIYITCVFMCLYVVVYFYILVLWFTFVFLKHATTKNSNTCILTNWHEFTYYSKEKCLKLKFEKPRKTTTRFRLFSFSWESVCLGWCKSNRNRVKNLKSDCSKVEKSRKIINQS